VTAVTAVASETRARVIDATIECILDEGFYRASSNRIAERAGVTWGVIQHHFGTREGLLLAAFDHSMMELIDILESAEIAGATFDARLESLTDVLWSFYRQPRFIAYEQLTLNLLRDPTIDAASARRVRRQQARIGARLTALAGQAVEGIEDVLPPLELFQILRGVAIGLNLTDAVPGRRRREPPGGDPERAILLAALRALVRACKG
jgi:AcrR family transcriptional regulator